LASDVRQHVVAYIESHRKIVEVDALDLILADRQPLILCQAVLNTLGPESPFVTREIVQKVVAGRASPRPPLVLRPTLPAASPGVAHLPAETEPFRLVVSGFSAPTTHQNPLEAYGRLFSDRYLRLSRILRGRGALPNVQPVESARAGSGPMSMIGMVREVRTTARQHHTILVVEDPTGVASVLIPRDSPLARGPYLSDEVLGLSLEFSKDPKQLPRAIGVERPDVAVDRPPGHADRPVRALFLSDLHVGSKSFLSDAWGLLIDFAHGRGPSAEEARGIEFVVIAGDLVDGIGIYPRQERDLAIADILEQYTELGRRLQELPSRMTIVVIPGNHDAVSPAEPQPALAPSVTNCLPSNVRSLANPSTFSLYGALIEAYHGRSFDDLIPALPGASYARPTDVMKRMLAMRHLAPIYGGRTPLAPLVRDGLVIDPAPDILVTGHAHTYGVDRYRDVLLLNVSTWQGETEYQRMRNITPVPARAAVVDLARPSRPDAVETLDASGARLVVHGGVA
jgi:DNA polymerase II small subunit